MFRREMKPRFFIITTFLLLAVVNFIYVGLYKYVVQHNYMANNFYKNFLLEKSDGYERIIVESGSNSNYGVECRMLEERFGRLAINIADNAGHPLLHKLVRLDKYAREGDVVLLPLEYTYYAEKGIPEFFFNEVFYELNFYFLNLTIWQQLEFIYQTPFMSFVNGVKLLNEHKRDQTFENISAFNSGYRGDKIFKKIGVPDKETLTLSCEEYIFSDNIKNNFQISDAFVKNLKYMKEIENRKKIRFVVTYPAVVGDGCYEGRYKENFIVFKRKIESLLSQFDIPFVGNYEDSLFERRYMDNTYFHILPDAKKRRTHKLIETIENSVAADLFQSNKREEFALDYRVFLKDVALKTVSKGVDYALSSDHEEILFVHGWYKKESWGIWSKDGENRVVFALEQKDLQEDLEIILDVNILNEKERIEVRFNEVIVGELSRGVSSFIIDKKLFNGKFEELTFWVAKVYSAKELGINNDTRKINIGLKKISFK